jgi:chitinase
VAITPANVTLSVGDKATFTAAVQGSANQTVTWTVQEGANGGGGIVTAAGVYTAPALPGTYHVVATSQADPSRTGVATVIVQAGSATGTIQ